MPSLISKRIFISYSSANKNFAEEVKRSIEEDFKLKTHSNRFPLNFSKLKCSILDVDDPITSTTDLFKRIQNEISRADGMVVIIGNEKQISPWIITEITIARLRKKPIIFLLRDRNSSTAMTNNICEGYPIIYEIDNFKETWEENLEILIDNIFENKSNISVLYYIVFFYIFFNAREMFTAKHSSDVIFYSNLSLKVFCTALFILTFSLFVKSVYFYRWRVGEIFNGAHFGEIVMDVSPVIGKRPEPGFSRFEHKFASTLLLMTFILFICLYALLGIIMPSDKSESLAILEHGLLMLVLPIPYLGYYFFNKYKRYKK